MPRQTGRRGFSGGLVPTLTLIALGTIGLLGIDLYVDRAVERSAEMMAQQLVPSLRSLESIDQSVAELAMACTAVAGRLEPAARAQQHLDAAARQVDVQLAAYRPYARLPGDPQRWRDFAREVDAFKSGVLSDLQQQRPQAFETSLQSRLATAFVFIQRSAFDKDADAVHALDDIARTQRREVPLLILVMTLVGAGCLFSIELARRRDRVEWARERALIARLERTNSDLDAFAGLIAHDLRNPLTPILWGSQLIERADVSADIRDLAGRIDRSARRLGRMIDGLLSFARTSGQPAGRLSTKVSEVVDEVLASFQERAAALDARFELRIAAPCAVACEREAFASVVQNLVENALKYGLTESPDRMIVIACQSAGADVLLTVEDHGPGIPHAVAQRIFEPLFQAGAAANGVGLGLATVRRLVEARGGSIVLTEGAARGATFEVRLPAASPA